MHMDVYIVPLLYESLASFIYMVTFSAATKGLLVVIAVTTSLNLAESINLMRLCVRETLELNTSQVFLTPCSIIINLRWSKM